LRSEGGEVALTGDSVTSTLMNIGEPEYEKVFGEERFVSFKWYAAGLERCRTIARFETPYGKGIGSGVLIRGGLIPKSCAQEIVVG
ncbi:MAG: hypothetical protein JO329_28080, partial [Planctomycetaceae bacterium]|nr:hypothetical protein [Planctomycetaceae bacterium]